MNLLLAPPEFKITDTGRGILREYLYDNGALFREYRSHLNIMGLPALVMTKGRNPETGKFETAEGFVAIGKHAKGVVAVGQFARGDVAIGQVALGSFVAIGQLALAPVCLGQFTLAVAAIGQFGIAVAGIFQIGWGAQAWTMLDLF